MDDGSGDGERIRELSPSTWMEGRVKENWENMFTEIVLTERDGG